MNTKSDKSILISVLSFGLIAILVIFSIIFAWFALTRDANTGLGVDTEEGLNLAYKLYWYQDPNFEGATTASQITLKDNVKDPETSDSYFYIDSTNQLDIPSIVSGMHGRAVAPGDRLSFALKLWNHSTADVKIRLGFNQVSSYISSPGDVPSFNRVQNAYQYSVTRIAYTDDDDNENDSPDNFDGVTITDAADKAYLAVGSSSYLMVDNLSIASSGKDYSIVVIFFDLYFDPLIDSYVTDPEDPSKQALDEEGIPITNNSNGFINQLLDIKKIMITRIQP